MNKVQEFLFKILFGVDLQDFVLGNVDASSMRKEIENIQQEIEGLKELIAEIIDMTGGAGFPETIQTSIANLDSRMKVLMEGLQNHKEVIESIQSNHIHVGSLLDPDKLKFNGN